MVKSKDYECNHPWLKTGLLNRFDLSLSLKHLTLLICFYINSKNEKWRSRRRLITPSFHDNQLLKNFMSIFNEQARILADQFVPLTKQATTHNLYSYISACTLDIITGSIFIFNLSLIISFNLESATGTGVNAQLTAGDNAYVQATLK